MQKILTLNNVADASVAKKADIKDTTYKPTSITIPKIANIRFDFCIFKSFLIFNVVYDLWTIESYIDNCEALCYGKSFAVLYHNLIIRDERNVFNRNVHGMFNLMVRVSNPHAEFSAPHLM